MLRGLGRTFSNQISKKRRREKAANFLILTANFALSLWLLSYAMQAMAMSVAYAIWTGIGAIGAVGVGVIFNGEKMSAQKAFYLSLITLSAVMLKIS